MTARPLFGRSFDAALFDMDGTILTSIVAAERVWAGWARGHGLDPVALLPTIHGIRAVDTVRRLGLPGVDPEEEAARITELEIEDVAGVDAIGGAARFLAALPPRRWAVVTSAPRRLARSRLDAAGLPMPPLMVTAEDVERGKPAPDGFLLAAARLGAAPQSCLIFEDAPAGIEAAERAGGTVVVVTATHARPHRTAHHAIGGYGELAVGTDRDGRIRLEPAST